MRLNRFIALSGVCSRREADNMITKGLVTVNGEVVKELGVKVQNGKDDVVVNGKKLSIRQFVYILMNKPKNVITSTDDEMGRKTVMEIVQHYTSVRVFPVGRLDRNTTGLLLFTNDGEMAKKLTHPSHGFEKLYHVKLDKPVSEDHLAQLRIGVELEDGLAQVDDIEYVTGAGRNEVGLKIHIGKNRIVRRMFEHLGYEVVMLDRTQLGPLHKQGLKRGTCRPLTEAEIGFLKMVQ
jgi:23S rRNA pseudouridine2605 synthase